MPRRGEESNSAPQHNPPAAVEASSQSSIIRESHQNTTKQTPSKRRLVSPSSKRRAPSKSTKSKKDETPKQAQQSSRAAAAKKAAGAAKKTKKAAATSKIPATPKTPAISKCCSRSRQQNNKIEKSPESIPCSRKRLRKLCGGVEELGEDGEDNDAKKSSPNFGPMKRMSQSMTKKKDLLASESSKSPLETAIEIIQLSKSHINSINPTKSLSRLDLSERPNKAKDLLQIPAESSSEVNVSRSATKETNESDSSKNPLNPMDTIALSKGSVKSGGMELNKSSAVSSDLSKSQSPIPSGLSNSSVKSPKGIDVSKNPVKSLSVVTDVSKKPAKSSSVVTVESIGPVIVDEVYDSNFILSEKMTITIIVLMTSDELSTIQWLARRGLLCNSITCDVCNEACTLSKHSNGIDGWIWRCNKDDFSRSIRTKSFFQDSHLSLRQILCIIYMWCTDYPQNIIAYETDVDNNSIVDWCNFLREECEHFIEEHPQQLGGLKEDQTPIDVEIESKYFHRKYHRGQWRAGHWVFGAIERESGRYLLIEVPDRQRDTLIPIIQEWILPGSRIISDGWAAYANIGEINNGMYIHDVIANERNFVDPSDSDVHTQLIENTWMKAKRRLRRQCGTNHELFASYLAEFVWRQRVGPNKFGEMLCCIKECYC